VVDLRQEVPIRPNDYHTPGPAQKTQERNLPLATKVLFYAEQRRVAAICPGLRSSNRRKNAGCEFKNKSAPTKKRAK